MNITPDSFSKLMDPGLGKRVAKIRDLREQFYKAVSQPVATGDDARQAMREIIRKAADSQIEMFTDVSTDDLHELATLDQLREKLVGIVSLQELITELSQVQNIKKTEIEDLLGWADAHREKIAKADEELADAQKELEKKKADLDPILLEITKKQDELRRIIEGNDGNTFDWERELIRVQLRMKEVVISDYFTQIALLSDFANYEEQFQKLRSGVVTEITEMTYLMNNKIKDTSSPEFERYTKLNSKNTELIGELANTTKKLRQLDSEDRGKLISIQNSIRDGSELSKSDWDYLSGLEARAKKAEVSLLPIVARLIAQAGQISQTPQHKLTDTAKTEWNQFETNLKKFVVDKLRNYREGLNGVRWPKEDFSRLDEASVYLGTMDKNMKTEVEPSFPKYSMSDRHLAKLEFENWQRRIKDALAVIKYLELIQKRCQTSQHRLEDLLNRVMFYIEVNDPVVCYLLEQHYLNTIELIKEEAKHSTEHDGWYEYSDEICLYLSDRLNMKADLARPG
jgi:hypothetical protein